MIYLDSPAGVGLSYSKNVSDYQTGDLKTAADSHTFLLKVYAFMLAWYITNIYAGQLSSVTCMQWFQMYPEFLSNPFYIAGESYAGVYVPTLSHEVVKGMAFFTFTHLQQQLITPSEYKMLLVQPIYEYIGCDLILWG
jgi:serine carboxypeptidase-like clade 1